MKILGLIPARGGSKGVPRKNIKLLNGRPLLAYTADAALKSKKITRVILSTDDAEIAAVGRKCGLDVPFMRPAELANDTAGSFPVVRHALESLEKDGEFFDAVCLLQPTNPLRRSEDIDGCIALFAKMNADSVISILPVPHENNPRWVFWKCKDGKMRISTGEKEPIARRQDLPPAFRRDGSIYISSRETISNGSLYGENVIGYEIDARFSANIDTLEDWLAVEQIMKPRGKSQTI